MSLYGPGEDQRVQYMLNIMFGRLDDFVGLKVLDLACRTGAFSAALARAGADVLGVDGRQENLDHVPDSTARFELADVRDITVETHGTFDVVLCLGILYHLEARDAVGLLASMRRMTRRFAIIDTHIGTNQGWVDVDGHRYQGCWYGENVDHPWSAIRNTQSWWFTEDSLREAIYAARWSAMVRIPGKGWDGEPADRAWLVVE